MNLRNIPILSILLYITISSCQPATKGLTERHEGKRDNFTEVSHVVSIDDNLPEIHAVTALYVIGDTLLFRDAM